MKLLIVQLVNTPIYPNNVMAYTAFVHLTTTFLTLTLYRDKTGQQRWWSKKAGLNHAE